MLPTKMFRANNAGQQPKEESLKFCNSSVSYRGPVANFWHFLLSEIDDVATGNWIILGPEN